MLTKLRLFFLIVTISVGVTAHAGLPAYDVNGKPMPSLAPMLKHVNPAVVNISTFSTQAAVNNPLMNDPFFRHFFKMPQQPKFKQQRRQRSAGSGVIVDKKQGIVITNHHVINNADEVHVALIDGRSFPAKVIGTDKELDVAILKIQADNLHETKLGNSDILEVGDFAVAIGNPFGLGQTVTTGIVSALGRTGLGIEGYENFIQTDASINPGNSGGALVNLRGQLIGINTAIIAPSGGNVGIGFAIPINMVKASMEQILEHGEVRRGRIGVMIQDITPELSQAFALKNGQQGVLVTDIVPNSAAAKAGLKPGDVIIKTDQQNTTSTGQLRTQIAIKSIGDSVEVGLIRDGKYEEFTVKVAKITAVTLNKLHKMLAGVKLENTSNAQGVLITNLERNSIAAHSGLRPGDIIIGANKKRAKDLTALNKALNDSANKVLLQINRNGHIFYLVIQ